MYPNIAENQLEYEHQGRAYTQHGKTIDKALLTNTLNHINFSNGTLLVNFRHTRLNSTIACRAKPLPCLGGTIACEWTGPSASLLQAPFYVFKDILVPAGDKLLLVQPDRINLDRDGISFQIPETCIDVSSRKARRSRCKDIRARLSQDWTESTGTLIDFSTVSLQIAITATPLQTLKFIDPQRNIKLKFYKNNQEIYSGYCRMMKSIQNLKTGHYIVEPLCTEIPLFEKKEFRNIRQELVPTPHVIFRHPFTGKTNTLKVIDISGSGFSVEEDNDSAVLLPGMIIPELELNVANSFKTQCKVQVVYKARTDGPGNGRRFKCGLALMDMIPVEHARLLSILYQAENDKSYLCNAVALDDLWEFFFETGFIYPEKYGFFEKNREAIKATYQKLYTANSEVARYFIYQENSRILGHIAMLRFYDNAWLIHHHAARKTGFLLAGLAVLNQISRFIHDSHRLASLKMSFVFCYYRPDNKFPERVFGGASRSIDDPKVCSIDTFAYFHYSKTEIPEAELPAPWRLAKAEDEDLAELKTAYTLNSDGLLLKALELESTAESDGISEVVAAYTKVGLKRDRLILALKKENILKAIFILNMSDIGLNMSDLTNSITALVIDPAELTQDILYAALAQQIQKFGQDEIPVLLHPDAYARKIRLPHNKRYNLWIMNTKCSDRYFRYMRRFISRLSPRLVGENS
jgi:hypothetical protein